MRFLEELIYESATDAAAFAALPLILATSFGARSSVLHWRSNSGTAEIFAHSGHYNDEQMANYVANFVEHDLWTLAAATESHANRAWKATALVSEEAYSRSVFYNEWIRPMGDDTYFCFGSVMKTPHGDGIIGLHRGKAQCDFDEEVVDRLNELCVHLRRMFAFRKKFDDVSIEAQGWRDAFMATRHPCLIVNSTGFVRKVNEAAATLLAAGTPLGFGNGRVFPRTNEFAGDFESCLSQATRSSFPTADSCLLVGPAEEIWVAEFLPLTSSAVAGSAMITLERRLTRSAPDVVAARLRRLHGLTEAEANVAIRLAHGLSIEEIAHARTSSKETIRSQLKQIMLKMGARRQSDVVAHVIRLS